jgi:hypothetical protein
MIYNVFAATMALFGITSESIDACEERRKADADGITCDSDFDRNILLYLLLSSICQDYIREAELAEDSELYKAIVGKLAKLADFITWGEFGLDFNKYNECVRKGVIPIHDEIVGFAGDGKLYEMRKQTFDILVGAFANMMRDGFGAISIKDPVDPNSLASWVTHAFEEITGKKSRNSFNMGAGRQVNDGSGLIFDL